MSTSFDFEEEEEEEEEEEAARAFTRRLLLYVSSEASMLSFRFLEHTGDDDDGTRIGPALLRVLVKVSNRFFPTTTRRE